MSGDDSLPASFVPDESQHSGAAITPRLRTHVSDTSSDGTPEAVLSAIVDNVGERVDDSVPVPEDVVTQSLPEILVALIAFRDDETHGTGLIDDLGRLFDAQPSPGTVYPRLHDLDADGVLDRHELVQTKQYTIADQHDAADLLERAMYQHLVLGRFLEAALTAIETD